MTRQHEAEYRSCRAMPLRVVRQFLYKLIPIGLMFGYILMEPGGGRLVKPLHLITGLEMIGIHRQNVEGVGIHRRRQIT